MSKPKVSRRFIEKWAKDMMDLDIAVDGIQPGIDDIHFIKELLRAAGVRWQEEADDE